MTLPELCIKRPVFATVLSLIILLVGLISYQRLSVREYPRIDEPVVSVNTTYRGASAEVVESQVTKILEDSLSGIEGVEIMTSQSRLEQSRINVRFALSRNPDSAAADVRDKVSRVRAKLPEAVDEPVIAKVEADSNRSSTSPSRPGSRRRCRPPTTSTATSSRGSRCCRRGGRAHLRRAPGVDAHQHRPHAARRLQAHRAGRRGRDPPPERRDPGRAHRVEHARVHGGRRDRRADARAVQQHHHRNVGGYPCAFATSAARRSARSKTA
jgi:hypothetical protein